MTLDQKIDYVNRTLTKKLIMDKCLELSVLAVLKVYMRYTLQTCERRYGDLVRRRGGQNLCQNYVHSQLVMRKHAQYSDDQWKTE